jgi:hypothetical protein
MHRKKVLWSICLLGSLAIAVFSAYYYTSGPRLTPEEREAARIASAEVQGSGPYQVVSVKKEDDAYLVRFEIITTFGRRVVGGHCMVIVGEDGIVRRVNRGA